MAISNYGELKTVVEDYINYGDTSLTSYIPMFIGFANAELNRVLRVPAMEQVIYHEVVAAITSLPVPADLLELKRIYYLDTYETIDQIDVESLPEMLNDYSTISGDSRPIKIARNGDNWYLERAAVIGTIIYITFWADVADMVVDTDTNVFLTQASQALLYRAVAEGHRFLENLELADYWMAKAEQEVAIIQAHADKAEITGSVIVQANNPW